MSPRRFEFARDSFAFPNELVWTYEFDAATGRANTRRSEPPPGYAHRCFVLTRAARQFLYHARFDGSQKPADVKTYRERVRAVISRNPRKPCAMEEQIIFPGYQSLREFSGAHEALIKAQCGGAWRSYVLRSHWRMVLPISRLHQSRTAGQLAIELGKNRSPIVHLVKFPALTINHGMILFDADESERRIEFSAYDPNIPERPATLTYDRAAKTFSLPRNHYWAGGELNVIEIFRDWLM